MKLGFVYSLQPSQFAAVSSGDGPEKSLTLLKDVGYDGVVLAIRDPRGREVETARALLERLSLPVIAISTGQAYVDEGISLSDPRPEIRKKAIERLKDHIELASLLNARVIVGLIRGRFEGRELPSYVYESFRDCDEYALRCDVELLLEPITKEETNFIHTAKEAIDFLKIVGARQFKLLLDTYHMHIEEEDLVEAIKYSWDWLGHIDIADSNREAPGRGEIDFFHFISSLKDMGYDGYLTAEIKPIPDFETAARETLNHLRFLLR